MNIDNLLIQNKYKIVGKVGSGAYSNVYKAINVNKKNIVAIKFETDYISKKLIENEISLYIELQKHKMGNICNIKSYGFYNDRKYIVMDFLPQNLEEYINEKKKQGLTKLEMVELFKKVYNIIKKLHAKDIVHRDIKPENFLVNEKGEVYIIDMGLSTEVNYNKTIKGVVGNNLFCSFNCHNEEYIYYKNDDIISIYYMFFYLLSSKDLPWKKITIDKQNKKNYVLYLIKKHTNYIKYYHDNTILKPIIESYIRYIQDNNII